jgi:hypothetical protein
MASSPTVTLRFTGCENIPCGLISRVLTTVDDSFFALQREHLRAASADLATFARRRKTPNGPVDVPLVAVDAALHRLDRFRGRAFLVQKASSGSIILAGVAGALAYWILDKTIGESVSEAWQRSELHKIVRDFFLMRFRGRSSDLADDIGRRLDSLASSENQPYSITVLRHDSSSDSPRSRRIESSADEIEIIIEIHGDFEVPPTIESLANGD